MVNRYLYFEIQNTRINNDYYILQTAKDNPLCMEIWLKYSNCYHEVQVLVPGLQKAKITIPVRVLVGVQRSLYPDQKHPYTGASKRPASTRLREVFSSLELQNNKATIRVHF